MISKKDVCRATFPGEAENKQSMPKKKQTRSVRAQMSVQPQTREGSMFCASVMVCSREIIMLFEKHG